MTPDETSELLWDRYRMKRNGRRLAQLRGTGQGPRFYRDGLMARYAEVDVVAWAEAQLGGGATSTSEEAARREQDAEEDTTLSS
jgi:hypothetical protein